jgi:hypothetical protein
MPYGGSMRYALQPITNPYLLEYLASYGIGH